MTVACCSGCHRMISISMIPGGNPVAREDPSKWASAYGSCPVCQRLFCDRCMASEPFCLDCPGPPTPRPLKFWVSWITRMCRKPSDHTRGEFLEVAWLMTAEQPGVSERIQMLQESLPREAFEVLCGMAAAEVAESASAEPIELCPELEALLAAEPELDDESIRAWIARSLSTEFTEALAQASPDDRK